MTWFHRVINQFYDDNQSARQQSFSKETVDGLIKKLNEAADDGDKKSFIAEFATNSERVVNLIQAADQAAQLEEGEHFDVKEVSAGRIVVPFAVTHGVKKPLTGSYYYGEVHGLLLDRLNQEAKTAGQPQNFVDLREITKKALSDYHNLQVGCSGTVDREIEQYSSMGMS